MKFVIAALLGVISAEEAKKTIVACVGDSVTHGMESASDTNYPKELQKLLGSDYIVHNFGKGGTTAMKSTPTPYWDVQAYQDALISTPDIVIFGFGSNDAQDVNWGTRPNSDQDAFINDYVDLANTFINLPSSPKIYPFISTPVYYENLWPVFVPIFGQNGKKIIHELFPTLIPQIAKDNLNLPEDRVIDLLTALGGADQKWPFLNFDGLHANTNGHYVVAKTIQCAIQQCETDWQEKLNDQIGEWKTQAETELKEEQSKGMTLKQFCYLNNGSAEASEELSTEKGLELFGETDANVKKILQDCQMYVNTSTVQKIDKEDIASYTSEGTTIYVLLPNLATKILSSIAVMTIAAMNLF